MRRWVQWLIQFDLSIIWQPFLYCALNFGAKLCIERNGSIVMGTACLCNGTGPRHLLNQGKQNLLAWFNGNNMTIDIVGVTFPSYRLFIIFLGVIMLIGLMILMRYSRLGMIIRAGVQDRSMVEALGINVRRVFRSCLPSEWV